MSRILPILFNTDMVRAILRDAPNNKTVTRRIVKGYIPKDAMWGYTMFTPKGSISCRGTFANEYGEKFFKLPCQKGDILYVRETWGWEPCWDCGMDTEEHNCCDGAAHKVFNHAKKAWGCYVYKALLGDNVYPSADVWHPSIHMPKEAARIWLKVTDVRVEHLQAMTLDDFLNEGVVIRPEAFNDPDNAYLQARGEFAKIWDSTVKKKEDGWDENPWVWVIEFEPCEKPDK